MIRPSPRLAAAFTRVPLAPFALCVALALAAPVAGAQVPRGPTVSRAAPGGNAPPDSPARVTMRVGDREYAWEGNARCLHTARGALFDRAGKSWTVQGTPPARAGLRSFALTLWHLDNPAARQQFSFYVAVDAGNHRISTMDGQPGHGRGEAMLTSRGGGGRIELTGRTETGTAIRATIECTRFAAPYAVGG